MIFYKFWGVPQETKLLLVNLGFFMWHIYCSEIELQICFLITQDHWSKLDKVISRNWLDFLSYKTRDFPKSSRIYTDISEDSSTLIWTCFC